MGVRYKNRPYRKRMGDLTWELWTGTRGQAFVSTVMTFILLKFYELHIYLLRIIPNK
jgi:hypothetical protein